MTDASCQVDFYVMARPADSAERLACRLALMAWEQGHRIVVLTTDESRADELDEIMWDYPAARFLPHGKSGDDGDAPVSITWQEADIPDGRDVLINLTDMVVDEPRRFTRLLEIVPAESARRLASRHKFRAYRELGLEPASHEIGKQ